MTDVDEAELVADASALHDFNRGIIEGVPCQTRQGGWG
jgi:hypothetical protein